MRERRVAPHHLWSIGGTLLGLFVVDRITKALALAFVPEGGLFACDRACGFIIQQNEGVAFSIPFPSWVLFVSVLVIVIVLIWIARDATVKNARPAVWGAGLMIVGALANAFDRIRSGAVIDFIRLTRWPTFNLADVYIIIGVSILIGFYLLRRNTYARPTDHSDTSRD